MSLRRRTSRLEEAEPPHPEVIGVRIDDGPVRVQGEEMSLEEFKAAYPEGKLIQIEVVNRQREH